MFLVIIIVVKLLLLLVAVPILWIGFSILYQDHRRSKRLRALDEEYKNSNMTLEESESRAIDIMLN